MSDRVPLWHRASEGYVEGGGWARRPPSDPVFDSVRVGDVLIWSGEHNAYWGPDRSGYYDRSGAGAYSFEDAYRYTAHVGPEKRISYERHDARPESAWRPIATAPESGFGRPRHYVLVRGPSGMVGTKHFVVKAYKDAEYRPNDPWRLVDNGALSDFGWEPDEWMEVPT